MAFAMAAILALVAFTGAQAAPYLVYPLMDQQPPVARVDTPFVFTLLPSTFNGTQGSVSYTTSDMPSWLSYNSGSAAFYGTPTSSDQGEQNVTLTATDNAGSTDAWFNLLVTNFTQPAVHQGFATQIANDSVAQLASVERLPEGTGISVPPYWSFSLGFLWETFRLSRTEPINGNLFFSARERGSTTLPSWLSFNNATMTFGGVAPSNGTFTIVATGTDYWGYTGAQTSFIIQVGTGEGIEMSRTANFSDIVTVSRAKVDYEVDISDIVIGGETATADQVVLSLESSDFSWLSIDRYVSVVSFEMTQANTVARIGSLVLRPTRIRTGLLHLSRCHSQSHRPTRPARYSWSPTSDWTSCRTPSPRSSSPMSPPTQARASNSISRRTYANPPLCPT